ncbi:M1 family aminopeptidase [Sphingobacterium multivorum]|uniref:M1 family aminopeptidase n=1 Tax=Sphingobacterium multivorum TaxID=28454 RepID=UPI002898C727|nr:M1 family aminopeptidase [Sphingobacterium multivorum]
MFIDYFLLEVSFYFPKKWFLALLCCFLAFGYWVSVIASFSFAGVYANSPFVLTYTIGLVSLLNIFTIVIFSSQIFLREIDARFSSLLYTTPVNKNIFQLSRFVLVFLITALTFLFFILGLMLGHASQGDEHEKFMPFRMLNYLQPYILLVLPNIFFCTATVSAIAWTSRSKMLVFLSGVFIYILYFAVSLFSNSPLFANASPVSSETMSRMAIVDPFGLAAFFEQCQSWSPALKNSTLLQLKGNFLINRIGLLVFSSALTLLAIRRARFHCTTKKNIKPPLQKAGNQPILPRGQISISEKGWLYDWHTLYSFLKIDLRALLKGLPFVVVIALWLFFLGMEIYSNIDAGMRLPQRYASTGLMVRNIINSFPLFLLSVLSFYGMETVWRSRSTRIYVLEDSTPVQVTVVMLAKWISLCCIALLLITISILQCMVLQLIFQYPKIEWNLYLSLFYILGVPSLLYASVIISIQTIVGLKYPALLLTVLFFALTNSFIGTMLGIEHPLFRFAKSPLNYSGDMNGFGAYLHAFGFKMIYWTSFSALIAIGTTLTRQKARSFSVNLKSHSKLKVFAVLMVAVLLISGHFIYQRTQVGNAAAEIDWMQHYEQKYRHYQHIPQPTIVSVKTEIDLYPTSNEYIISGLYKLVNKSAAPLDSLLLYTDPAMELAHVNIDRAVQKATDSTYGHHRFKLTSPFMPGDSITMEFTIKYKWTPFNRHDPMNAILANGSFMRISRYYPIFGYQHQNEIEDPLERKKRALGKASALKKLEQPDVLPYDYGYVDLETIISSDSDQTCIATGEFIRKWQKGNRNFFHYKSTGPIPFRFGISSAVYMVEKSSYDNISIEVYYDSKHAENVKQLINDSKQTLAYCQNNFGKYPFKSIRFVEISGFVSGFNATAYPGMIFMNENMTFHSDLRREKTRDVINELAGHELSHQWWGNSQIDPDDRREGATMLTETLAMYTELMCYKHKHGPEGVKKMVKMYQDLYDIGKANSVDEALMRVSPGNTNVAYYKGLLAMYQLHELIGEQKINTALRTFLQHYAFPHRPPTSEDLIHEFLRISEPALHKNIRKLFL